MSTNGHNSFVNVGPLADGETGFSCTDIATGLRLNLRQINGQGLEHVLSGPFSGPEAEAQIHEVLMEAMERVGAIMQEHGVHLVQKPPGLEREM
ncbi:MAG: hypothetical protein H6858_01555 [Rhodospirillales bacterium]|nr:hypothetical protein [Alphaproteobacteria bacterium]MCB1841253.1 hypothetical protein [Alphaproteobacteria bacterium]MCB9976268.1 hypothetical protein [Rhodospirillales bacterium]